MTNCVLRKAFPTYPRVLDLASSCLEYFLFSYPQMHPSYFQLEAEASLHTRAKIHQIPALDSIIAKTQTAAFRLLWYSIWSVRPLIAADHGSSRLSLRRARLNAPIP